MDPVLPGAAGDTDTDTQDTYYDEPSQGMEVDTSQNIVLRQDSDDMNSSENIFPESPVYEPEDTQMDKQDLEGTSVAENIHIDNVQQDAYEEQDLALREQIKRKLSDDLACQSPKVQKLDVVTSEVPTQVLDDEVSDINLAASKRKLQDDVSSTPTTTRVLTPVRSSPRKITKRSNSCTSCCDSIRPRTPRGRCASVDLTKEKPFVKSAVKTKTITSKSQSPIKGNFRSGPSVEFVKEVIPISKQLQPIEEINTDPNDSQSFHLQFSPSTLDFDEPKVKQEKIPTIYNSEPILPKDRNEILTPGKIHNPSSVGYNYSDQSSRNSQSLNFNDYHKSKINNDRTTDQESTDSVSSILLDSPDPPSTMASKLINKLSNGNSSTPTESVPSKMSNGDDSTPDVNRNGHAPGKNAKNEFRTSNTTTPSTISPLQNGHSNALRTPSNPVFDIHVGHDDEGEFLSLYIVRTDNNLGMEMCKEFQRVSKRSTIDPYLADLSRSNSPSSVTSVGMINLPNRTSFTSTITSSTSGSNRTSDGAFIVPQPPGKTLSNQGTTSVKGYKALVKKINEMFSHVTDVYDAANHSTNGDDKVSAGVQVSPSILGESIQQNGSASPEEVSRCDRATPKSSLKKSKVKGRRPIVGKTKRAILPTQAEEPEYMQEINSPELVPSGGEIKDPNDKDISNNIGTPKSINKLKDKKKVRPASPRPDTPLDLQLSEEVVAHGPGTLVLAKWVDKRYYSGKVHEVLEPNNKYLIEFDDGHMKAVLEEFIIFGNKKELPLVGQSLYAMVDEQQNYEPGLVLAVDTNHLDTVTYTCTTDGDATVSVTAPEIYLTEDQAKSLKESCQINTPSAPSTPRRRLHRELDLENIIHGPRSARKAGKKRATSPKSPKASTSGIKGRTTTPASGARKRRPVSESSEVSDVSNSGAPVPPPLLEEVAGVEPEVQKTPRKIDGVKAGPLQLKGAARQTVNKKNSKLNKFENDADTISLVGPIPGPDSKLFEGMHFLLTCTVKPPRRRPVKEIRHYSSEEDCDTATLPGTDHEDLEFSDRPFIKERLREQIVTGGGTVYSHFEDVPKQKYSSTRLVAPRPCLTAMYIQCLAADIRPITHTFVILTCIRGVVCDIDAYSLPAGWSIMKECFINWVPSVGRRSTTVFKDKVILLCGDQDTFVKFWDRVCTLVGASTRVVNEDSLYLTGGLAVVTEWDCPHEVQNKANQDNIPLVSTKWVVQCLIEGRIVSPTGHEKFSFMYTEPE